MPIFPLILTRIAGLPFAKMEALRVKDLIEFLEDNNSEKDWEEVYEAALIDIRKKLQQYAGNSVLRNGLLLSSQSFLDRLERFAEKDPARFRKKERQTERSLLQYLTRASVKTSPFSSFTSLCLNDLNGNSCLNQKGFRSHVQLNNYLLAYLQDLLEKYPSFYQYLPLRWNSSCEVSNSSYTFLLNTRNLESVQHIEQDELLNWLYDFFRKNPEIRLEKVITSLKEVTGEDKDNLTPYVLELIGLGLLEWEWGLSGGTKDWDESMFQLVHSMPPFELKNELLQLLKELRLDATSFCTASFEEKQKLTQSSYDRFYSFCLLLNPNLEKGPPLLKTSMEKVVKKFEAGPFLFTPERMFYEDVTYSANLKWKAEEWQKLCEKLETFSEVILPYQEYELKRQLLEFYKQKFTSVGKIPLFTLYQQFYKNKTSSFSSTVISNRHELAKKVKQELTWNKDFIVHLPLNCFRLSKKNMLSEKKAKSKSSYGVLLQLATKRGTYKSYVDASFIGYGKMLGRFLSLFPPQHTLAIRHWIKEDAFGETWIENKDASYYNPNLHPSLFEYEIKMPGSQNNCDLTQQIEVSNLVVDYDEEQDELVLEDLGGDRCYRVFDFGFEALNSRSPLYQLLSTFSLPVCDYNVVKQILLDVAQKKTGEVYRVPRIVVEEQIILMRKTWFVPKEEVPFMSPGEKEAAYFKRLYQWRQKLDLPDYVFYTIAPPEVDHPEPPLKRDDYKPQFLDFYNPLLVQLFSREIKRVGVYLKLEEMLPSPDELENIDGKRVVTEMVVQWTRGNSI